MRPAATKSGFTARVVRDRAARMRAPLLSVGALGLATLALRLRDPHESGSWGACPSALAGFWCPGCGGLRAVNDLTHLRIGDALSSNVVLVVLVPFVVLALALWTRDRWRGGGRRLPDGAALLGAWVLLPTLAVFTVLRNLPVPPGQWLAP